MARNVIADARTLVRRDPGFAIWILVSKLQFPLKRAIQWARTTQRRS